MHVRYSRPKAMARLRFRDQEGCGRVLGDMCKTRRKRRTGMSAKMNAEIPRNWLKTCTSNDGALGTADSSDRWAGMMDGE